MSEWWTYTLSDFLLFSPRTYYRLFELYNAAIWPAQIAAVAAGVFLAALARRGGEAAGRLAAGILAGCWLFVALAFHAARYATINWAAVYFAWAFGLEAALLLWFGVVRRAIVLEPAGRGFPRRAGLAILVFALAALPLLGPLRGRPWRQVELFGVAPDPTAVGALGVLLFAAVRPRRRLLAIPVLWCAVSGATLLAMKEPGAWLMFAAAALGIALSIGRRDGRR
jgi:hypothetical protein